MKFGYKTSSLLLGSLLLTPTGCSGSAPIDDEASGDARAVNVPSDWVGYELGLAPPTEVGVQPLDSADVIEDVEGVGAEETAGADELLMIDRERGVRYRLKLGARDLKEIGKVGYEATLNESDDVREPTTGTQSQALITGGVDTRVRRGMSDGVSATAWPERSFGQVDLPSSTGWGVASCSGVFVGGRIILTAAHCMYNEIHRMGWPDFSPRRDGWDMPWGSWRSSAAHIPAEYENLGCHTNPDQARCAQWDYAVVILKQPAGFNRPGYMCVNYRSMASMNSEVLKSSGYPGCGVANAPANCVDYRLYTDSRDCVASSESYTDADGWKAVVRHDCDTNRGNSGGPVYVRNPTYHPNCNGSLVGITTAEDPVAKNNVMRRITPALYNTIAYFRSIYP